jgi:YHS domain-containing protein
MNLIRRSAWAVVMLGAIAGCTDDGAENAPTNPPATPNMAPKTPVVPPSAQTEKVKEGASKEMQPPPEKPDEKNAGGTKKAEDPPKVEGPNTDAKGDTAAVKLTSDEIAAIKELPAAEQEQALKQAVCPVSGEHLGSMEKPYKTTAEGRTFYLCCENCQKEVKTDAKKVLAKLDAQSGKK